MPFKSHRIAWLMAAVVLAGGCGSPQVDSSAPAAESAAAGGDIAAPAISVTAESLGACPPDYDPGVGGPEVFPAEMYFSDPSILWMEMSSDEGLGVFTGDAGSITRHADFDASWISGFESATFIRGGPIDTLMVTDTGLDRATTAAEAGATLFVAYSVNEAAGNSVRLVVAVLPSGDLASAGACDFQFVTEPLRRVHQAAAPELDSLEFLRSLTADMSWAVAAFDSADPSPKPVAWVDRDPALRMMEDAPESVLSQYREVLVYFEASDAWWSMGDALCTKNPQGWGYCISLHLGMKVDTELEAWVLRGAPDTVEIWLLDSNADHTDPIAFLGSFEVGAGDQELVVRLTDSAYSVDGSGPWILDVLPFTDV